MRALKRVIAITLLSILPMLTAQSAPAWYICEVTMTGMGNAGISFIRLTDLGANPAFTDKFFSSSPGISNQILATALAAMTADMRVFVNLDASLPGIPTANNVYLMK